MKYAGSNRGTALGSKEPLNEKITKKKTLTAVTGATVIGVAAAALVNGSKLDSVFNPGKFEKFENNYKSEEYDYVAGDGEETDIAGDNVKDKQKTSGDDLRYFS